MSNVHRRSFVTGAATMAGVATSLAASGALSAAAQTTNMDATRLGAKANGKDDDAAALQSAFAKMSDAQVISLPPGRYHLSKPVEFPTDHGVLLGYGAVLDNTLIVSGKHARVLGIAVSGSPSQGFRITRGQGAHFEALSAEDNNGSGFVIGGGDNNQIAWASFVGCSSLRNKGHGWHLDATHQRNWINANTFMGCWSRGNDGMGWYAQGRANYNTWMGCEVEDNCHAMHDSAPVTLEGSENFIYGGHFNDSMNNGTAAKLGSGSMVFGGRFIGNIDGAEFAQARIVSSLRRGLKRAVNDALGDD